MNQTPQPHDQAPVRPEALEPSLPAWPGEHAWFLRRAIQKADVLGDPDTPFTFC